MRATCPSRLKSLRKRSRVTQKYLAKLLDISPRTYCDYEHGRRRMPLECLISLARYYDVDLNYITGVSNIRREFPKG